MQSHHWSENRKPSNSQNAIADNGASHDAIGVSVGSVPLIVGYVARHVPEFVVEWIYLRFLTRCGQWRCWPGGTVRETWRSLVARFESRR